MSYQFIINTQLIPNGITLPDSSASIQTISPANPYNYQETAAPNVTYGSQEYEFLYWNTGRGLTDNPNVAWKFTAGGWSTWTATRVYGPAPGKGPNGGDTIVGVSEISLLTNQPLTAGSPIDGPASSFPNSAAWPCNGNTQVIDTVDGSSKVVAQDQITVSSFEYPFVCWQFFPNNNGLGGGQTSPDAPVTDTGSSQYSSGFYTETGSTFSLPKGASGYLVAGYGGGTYTGLSQLQQELLNSLTILSLGLSGRLPVNIPIWSDPAAIDSLRVGAIQDLLVKTRPGVHRGPGPGPITDPAVTDSLRVEILKQLLAKTRPRIGDPAAEDLLRVGVLDQLLAKTQPGGSEGGDFDGLIKAAPTMTREQLRRAIQSVKTTLGLGKSALAALEAQLKKKK
jgi:hypothetical protein